MIRQDHQTYQRKLVQSFKQNQKKFYAYVRTKQSVKTKVCRILKSDGSMTSSDKETADVLGEQFQSVFFSRNENWCCSRQSYRDYTNWIWWVYCILKKLSSLKIDKWHGPDGIHPMFRNRTASVLAKPVTALFAKSYHEGTIPNDWKLALISPIFKKGSKDRAENYRPISLTSVLCKVMDQRQGHRILVGNRRSRHQIQQLARTQKCVQRNWSYICAIKSYTLR